jgi:hypothetical protein
MRLEYRNVLRLEMLHLFRIPGLPSETLIHLFVICTGDQKQKTSQYPVFEGVQWSVHNKTLFQIKDKSKPPCRT